MSFCVIDTERIKGDLIYLLAYQIYNNTFDLMESKTFQDVSISLDNRKSPKRKVQDLKEASIKVSSFLDLFQQIKPIIESNTLIVFSKTDIGVLRRNCKNHNLVSSPITYIDVQEALAALCTNDKKKSNLKDYCKKNNIKYHAHIPEDDCRATFTVYVKLISQYGDNFLDEFKHRKI